MSGLISAVFSIFQVGMEPILLFYGLTHGGVALFLWGGGMSLAFDGRKEWRERFHLDENATHKLGKSVIRLGISLPYIVLYALAPKEGAAEALFAALAGGLVLTGVVAMFRMRTWGVAALIGGTLAMGASLVTAPFELAPFGNGYALNVTAAGVAAVLLIAAALDPARPSHRALPARVARALRGDHLRRARLSRVRRSRRYPGAPRRWRPAPPARARGCRAGSRASSTPPR